MLSLPPNKRMFFFGIVKTTPFETKNTKTSAEIGLSAFLDELLFQDHGTWERCWVQSFINHTSHVAFSKVIKPWFFSNFAFHGLSWQAHTWMSSKHGPVHSPQAAATSKFDPNRKPGAPWKKENTTSPKTPAEIISYQYEISATSKSILFGDFWAKSYLTWRIASSWW